MNGEPETAKLIVEFTGYWISGAGTAGAGLDDVTYRDDQDCPAMPMTQIKGQLRETARRLWPEAEVDALFGTETASASRNEAPKPERRSPVAFLGEARLSEPVRRWFATPAGQTARQQLFRSIASTRIDDNGVAADRTLRRIEVAVPVTLEGEVRWRGPGAPALDWVRRLDLLCAATLAFGKGKSDGLGRAIACCIEERPG